MDQIATDAAVRRQLYFDDIEPGAALPRRTLGPITTMHIMRWSAAMENWHRIHYDQQFAREIDGLPNVLVNGSWKQQVLCHYVKDIAGRDGWMWRIRFEFRDMDVVNNTVIAGGKVEEKAEHDGLGYIRCSLFLTNQNDKVTTNGATVIVLPKRGGVAVPYPFVPTGSDPVAWP